jgi:hypothetical protein
MLKVMEKGALREASREVFELDEIALAGARRMLMAALKTEAADYAPCFQFHWLRDDNTIRL